MAAKLFTASCSTCYSARLENVSKKTAAWWCTSHESAYGHKCGIFPVKVKK